MSAGLGRTHRFDPALHNATDFDCGNQLLNRWLSRYAGQNDRSDAARTFVIADTPGDVLG